MFLELVINAVSYSLFALYIASMALPILALLCIPSSYPWVKLVYGFLSKITCKFLLFMTFLPVTYQGVESFPKEPVIFIANHQSSLDIMLVGSVIGSRPSVWLSKRELFEYPVLGQLLGHIGIPVNANDGPRSSLGTVEKAVQKLKEGFDVIIFPEGARYNDGTIHSFYSGFAAIAKLSGAQVVPLFISGTGWAMAPGQSLIRRAPLIITVGKPFVCGKEEAVQEFKDRVHGWFAELNFKREYLLEHYNLRICGTDLTPAGIVIA